jgi:hypothetical protein
VVSLAKGTRVRLRSVSHVLTLAAGPSGDLGRIVGRDELDYYLVRLDRPAKYDDGVVVGYLREILEDADNLEVVG